MDLRLFVIEPEGLRRRLICDLAGSSPGVTITGAVGTLRCPEGLPAAEADIFVVNASLLASERHELRNVSDLYPEAHFVLVDSQPNLDALLGSADLPVRGFLSLNHLSGDEFTRALSVTAYGGAVIEPISAQLLLKHLHSLVPAPTQLLHNQPDSTLTSREQEVLEQVRKGLSNKEIARRMNISLGTVRAHLRNIFRKLDVTSRAGAAVSSLSPRLHRNTNLIV